jgi:benzoyl-CoA reductase/2-hydroxyglutaryl-CoA dehydratase subunit BcrC/BadD/HgdB
MAISNKEKISFIEMRAQGKSLRSIASDLGIAYNTCLSLSRENVVEVSNQKASNIEMMMEAFNLQRVARLKSLAKQIEKVQKELDLRDLSEVSTEKLYTILGKLNSQLEEKLSAINFKQETDIFDSIGDKFYINLPIE